MKETISHELCCCADSNLDKQFLAFLFTLAAELQLTSYQEGVTSQHDNSSLSMTYSATVLEGGEQVCLPEEQELKLDKKNATYVPKVSMYVA